MTLQAKDTTLREYLGVSPDLNLPDALAEMRGKVPRVTAADASYPAQLDALMAAVVGPAPAAAPAALAQPPAAAAAAAASDDDDDDDDVPLDQRPTKVPGASPGRTCSPSPAAAMPSEEV